MGLSCSTTCVPCKLLQRADHDSVHALYAEPEDIFWKRLGSFDHKSNHAKTNNSLQELRERTQYHALPGSG